MYICTQKKSNATIPLQAGGKKSIKTSIRSRSSQMATDGQLFGKTKSQYIGVIYSLQ